MFRPLPIEVFVRSRLKELGLSRSELAFRAGYRNATKGLRRLDELFAGDFQSTRGLVAALPAALALPKASVQHALEASLRQISETKEAASLEAFRPHAIILTERLIPQPLHIAALLGIARLKRVEFDLDCVPTSFVNQTLCGLNEKLETWQGIIPTFGAPTGFVINYRTNRAVRYDLDGNPIDTFAHAVTIGDSSLSVRGNPCSSNQLRRVMDISSGDRKPTVADQPIG